MTKSIKVFLSTAFFAVLAVSCRESIEPAYPAVECEGTMDICVNGLMGEYTQQDGVKSSLVNNVRVAWAAGDVVYVFDGSKYLGKLTAALDKKADGQPEDRYAKLSGTISVPATTPCVLSLVHSSLMTEPAAGAAVSELSIDMSVQSTATVPFVAYAILDYTGESITDAIVPFQFATSVIKVNCTGLEANTAITSATLSNVNTACKLTLSGSAAPTVSGGTNGTITRTNDEYFAATKVNAEGEAVFQIAVPALETASSARVLTVFQDSYKAKDKKFTTNSLAAATSVNTVCQLGINRNLENAFSVSDGKQVYFSKGNLWYGKVGEETEPALHFETNQWESIPIFKEDSYGTTDHNHISHFTWSDKVADAVGNSNSGSNLFCDENHKQSVDGSAKIYYALSKEEWDYLLKERTMLYGKNRYSVATNSGVIIDSKTYYGLFLYPDDYSGNEVGTTNGPDTWDGINDAGIVFLPAAGDRNGDDVCFGTIQPYPDHLLFGKYWTSLSGYCTYIGNTGARTETEISTHGCSLRLVADAQ